MAGPATVADAARELRSGACSSVGLTRSALARADALGFLGAYVTRLDDPALAAAERADAGFAVGADAGPLQGISVAIKDLLCTAEAPTTAQSLVLDPAWGAGRDAAVVTALRRGGAVITGKASLSEFAIGRPDPSKPFPIPRNPWNPGTWPGGSSSGTAVGIAAGLFLAGIGTDTGGSIRIPAAFCGISGLKPTYGLVPTEGCVPLAFSQDHVGPMARTAEDCRTILEVIADPSGLRRSRRTRLRGLAGANADRPLRGLRVGAVRADHFGPGCDPAAEPCFDAVLGVLEQLGAEVRAATLPRYRATRAAGLAVIQAEGFAYHRTNLAGRWSDFFDTTREMLAYGALLSGADYVQAQRVRAAAQRGAAALFEDHHVVVTPTLTIGSPAYGPDFAVDVGSMLDTIHTGYWNCTGSPALAIPMGFTATGLPLSFQIVGAPFHDHLVTDVGEAIQRATDWHRRMPSGEQLGTWHAQLGTPRAPGPRVLRTPVPDSENLQTVRALLAAAGITGASEHELAALAYAYPGHRRALDSLYAEPYGDLAPAVRFAPDLPH
jgi:aspartyl-tRNA(Asn)/glutamyl-tRNA(Gln) amidotransferase subunit A